MKVDRDTADAILNEEHEDYKEVDKEHVDESRWAQHWVYYYERTDGRFFALGVQFGSTECQDGMDAFYDEKEVDLTEVRKVKKTIDAWEDVEQEQGDE